MFYSVTGNFVYYDAQCFAIDCNGVAFKCFATTNTLKNVAKIGEKITLFTYLSVKEDALDLYGFYTQQELECYKILISVSGVGAKMALAVLSEMTPEQLTLSIAAGDAKAITRANGVGNKIAQRIVLELKDKLAKGLDLQAAGSDIAAATTAAASGNSSEAVSALTMLGYSQSEAAVAVGKLNPDLSVEEMIKQALKQLSMI